MKTPIHILVKQSQGKRDARRGVRPLQENRYYLEGYSRQYELEVKRSANIPF